jgi:CTP synthase
VNNELLSSIENGGLMMSATSEDEGLCEVVELEDHPWFLGCQFHPEFTSTPIKGHPLFNGFIAAAIENISKK